MFSEILSDQSGATAIEYCPDRGRLSIVILAAVNASAPASTPISLR